MILNVSISEEDYIKFQEYAISRQTYGKQIMRLYKYVIPVIGAAIVVLHLVSGIDRRVVLVELILLAAISAAWMKISPRLYKRNMKRNLSYIKKGGRLPYHEESTVEWADDGVIERTEESFLKIPYDEIQEVAETDDYWYVFYAPMKALILPKRDIRAQMPELEQALRGRQ